MERLHKQDLVLNLSLSADFQKSAKVDQLLEDTMDYAKLSLELEALIQERKFETLEALVWECSSYLFSHYSALLALDFEAIKPTALSQCPKAGLRLCLDRKEWEGSTYNA